MPMSITCCAGETRRAGEASATGVACRQGEHTIDQASHFLISGSFCQDVEERGCIHVRNTPHFGCWKANSAGGQACS